MHHECIVNASWMYHECIVKVMIRNLSKNSQYFHDTFMILTRHLHDTFTILSRYFHATFMKFYNANEVSWDLLSAFVCLCLSLSHFSLLTLWHWSIIIEHRLNLSIVLFKLHFLHIGTGTILDFFSAFSCNWMRHCKISLSRICTDGGVQKFCLGFSHFNFFISFVA